MKNGNTAAAKVCNCARLIIKLIIVFMFGIFILISLIHLYMRFLYRNKVTQLFGMIAMLFFIMVIVHFYIIPFIIKCLNCLYNYV